MILSILLGCHVLLGPHKREHVPEALEIAHKELPKPLVLSMVLLFVILEPLALPHDHAKLEAYKIMPLQEDRVQEFVQEEQPYDVVCRARDALGRDQRIALEHLFCARQETVSKTCVRD